MKDEVFLPVFAIVTLVACGIAGIGCLLTAVLLFGLLADEPLKVVGPHSAGTLLLVASNLRLFVLSWLFYFGAGFAASLGLLIGRRWARSLWVVLLGLLIGWFLFVMGVELFWPHPPDPSLAPRSAPVPSFASMAPFVVLPVAVGMITLAAWSIWRLQRFGHSVEG